MTSLEIARKQINDSLFMLANRTKNTYFTKETAKMSFKDAIYFILKGLRKTQNKPFHSLGKRLNQMLSYSLTIDT